PLLWHLVADKEIANFVPRFDNYVCCGGDRDTGGCCWRRRCRNNPHGSSLDGYFSEQYEFRRSDDIASGNQRGRFGRGRVGGNVYCFNVTNRHLPSYQTQKGKVILTNRWKPPGCNLMVLTCVPPVTELGATAYSLDNAR